ncbi:MAG: HD domain-containing protein [Chthoniobacterales bacterium]
MKSFVSNIMPSHSIHPVLRAAAFAARKHRSQTRADGVTPYFSHVTRVTFVLRDLYGIDDPTALAAAFLHDTLEDTDTDYDELADNFGKLVADYVVALTKNAMLPKNVRDTEYFARLAAAPEVVQIIKLADCYDNVTDRAGGPKMPKTMETAKKLLVQFEPNLRTEAGKKASRFLQTLISEIETGE